MYLVIDLGTTGCRSILFDSKLRQLGQAYEEYPLILPREGWVEQDANLWWDMTLRTAAEVIKKTGTDPKTIGGVSVSSQGITVVPVDENIRPMCNALSWLDVRAETQTRYIGETAGEQEMFAHTGKPVNASYTLPKLLWLRENQPDVFHGAYKFLMPMDFLTAKLTGNCVTDHSMASGTLLYDLKSCCWSKRLLERFDIPESKLPDIRRSGEKAGTVLPQVAAQLGLREDCTVAVGAQDQKCAALGAGLQDGTMTISLGTAAAITKLWPEAKTGQITNVGWCGYVKDSTWVTEGVINTAGTCLRWVRDLLFPGEDYDTINAEAAAALEYGSAVLFYPYLSAAEDADGAGTFYGVTLATTRGHFAAAVMEGVAFQIRKLLETMDAYGNIQRLVLFGGGAKSELWCQIIADITGIKIIIPSTEEAAGAGAAMLAAMAAGQMLPCLDSSRSYQPSERRQLYEKKYEKYCQIEGKLWHKEGTR